MAKLNINGKVHDVQVEPDTPLLWVLREQVGLTGTKYGCGMAQCGACTVHLDGQAVRSCVLPVGAVAGRAVTTIEGLSSGELHPVQKALIAEQAAQCGYCIAGIMMRVQALLQKNPKPSEEQIRAELEPHLCRCGTHMRILRAVHRAIRLMDTADASSATPRRAQ